MRVLHFYKTYYPETMGGVEQVIHQLTRSSMKLGVQAEVLSLSSARTPTTIEMHGHQAHQARMSFQIASTGFSFSAFSHFKALARDVDIIHYHYPWPFMDLVHFATRIKKPTVVTYHSDIVRQKNLLKLYQPLGNKFLSSVDSIVATSPNYATSSECLQRYTHKTTIIPIGLDKSTYPTPSLSLLDTWRARFPERFFLFVGVLRYYKGLATLLEASKRCDYPLVIVGKGPVEMELKRQAAELNLKHVHFVGALSDEDKVALLMLCHALVFPSNVRSEAFGISLLEGAMYGKPMISCEIGTGTSYINCHEKTGFVVPANDPGLFGQAMQSLWEDPTLAHQMGEEAERRYWSLFTADRMAMSYVDLYKRIG